MSFLISKRVLGAMVLLLSACATRPVNPDLQLMSEGEYASVVNQNTQEKKIYDGFMNTMDVAAVMLTSKVLAAQAEQSARIYQWSPEQFQTEKAKSEATLPKQTDIFLSFFVPDRKHDDLSRATTKWRIFMDASGRRFEGKAARIKAQLVELRSFYPQHTRWHTAYKLSFPVPMSLIEKENVKLTLTGPVGSVTLEFPPQQ